MKYKSKANKIGNQSLAMLGLRIIDTVIKSGIEEAKTSKKFLVLVEVNGRYQIATVPGDEKQVSDSIKALFSGRKAMFNDIYTYMEGLLKSPDLEMREAAVVLFPLINKFGKSFQGVKISDQSLQYIQIIDSLKASELVPALTATKLTEKVDAFDQLQQDYEELYMGRGNESSIKIAPSNLRKEMESAIKSHFDEVHWMASDFETEPWQTLCKNIEQRFEEVNVSMSRQSKTTVPATDANQTKASA
jgi:hypothetical protein